MNLDYKIRETHSFSRGTRYELRAPDGTFRGHWGCFPVAAMEWVRLTNRRCA